MTPEKSLNTDLFDRAAFFAINAHSGVERREKAFPYALHVMEAAAIVASMTNDQDLIAAALLHDVVEDTVFTEEDISREFGDRISAIVSAETDFAFPDMDPSECWELKKKMALSRLAVASRDVKIVALGDKLSNMRAIARDFDIRGDEIWKVFHAPDPTLHEWRYRSLAAALAELKSENAYQEFCYLIDKTFSRAYWNRKEQETSP